MLSSNLITFKNLRILSRLAEGQYLCTDSNGNILGCINNYLMSTLHALIYRETWETNLRALKKIYEDEVPKLLDKIFESKEIREPEISMIYHLLKNSRDSLDHLKIIFTEEDHIANLDSLKEDFLDVHMLYIIHYMKEYGIPFDNANSYTESDSEDEESNLETMPTIKEIEEEGETTDLDLSNPENFYKIREKFSAVRGQDPLEEHEKKTPLADG